LSETLAATLAVVIFVGAYVLLTTEKVHRTKVALVGAGLMLVFHITDAEHAFFDEETAVDWNVVFLLLGMMVIVSVLRRTGIFEYIPVTFLVCERLGLAPVPFLIAEVMASNIGGTATLVGDPPNIIIASRAGITFNEFLVHLLPWIVFLMVVFCLLCRWLFRSAFSFDPERAESVMSLNEREAIKDHRLLIKSGVVLLAVVAAFVLHPVLHYEPSIVALLGAGVLVLITGVTTEQAMSEVEWPTLVFFAGLFVMVGALVDTGSVGKVSEAMAGATEGRPVLAVLVLLFGSAGVSAIVDNIPYVATMSPVVAGLVPTDGPHVLWWALALGADLGGNATAIGASANVVMLGIAERAGHPIGFWRFTKYGVVVTLVTITLSAPYLYLRYL
jgi:Na+/H+ antiporter NhaD/arsenite permease-like protein